MSCTFARTSAAAGLLAALLLSGCGGGDEPSTDTPNQAPQALIAGAAEQPGRTGQVLTLDGRGSRDPDGQALDYRWRIVAAPAGSALAGRSGQAATFALTPDVVGDYTVALSVSDGQATSAEVSVRVRADWVIRMDYGGYQLTYDCTDRTALQYSYVLQADTGSAARPSSFALDPTLPTGCGQQFTANSYASVNSAYDRGHLVTSNHMDYDAEYIRRANYMTNIVPQVGTFNRNVWLDAENVAECYRDLAPTQVYGGVVYSDTTNDFFLASHGIRTPDWFWKAIITTDPSSGAPKAIAWLIPNVDGLTALDPYLISIAELEQRLGAEAVGIPASAASDAVRAMRPATSWPLPAGCNLN
jgi:endonuclease G